MDGGEHRSDAELLLEARSSSEPFGVFYERHFASVLAFFRRRVRGPDSDPAGYHLIRGWVPAGVRADVIDPDDPTPYWFVASRRPDELAAAIEAARAR